MTYHTPIADADLHAYLDDQLTPERRAEVETYLRNHPDAEKLQQYLHINEAIQNQFNPVLQEPIPAALQVPVNHQVWWRSIAAIITLLTIGGLIGWLLHDMHRPIDTNLVYAELAQPAAFAHKVYTTDQSRPVELNAAREQELINWLSTRMRSSIKAPNLSTQGYELIGGRLLPSTNRMAAQFMYQDQDRQRLTLYIRRGAWKNKKTVFHYARTNDINTFYWIDGDFGYALSGNQDKTQLLQLTKTVQTALEK